MFEQWSAVRDGAIRFVGGVEVAAVGIICVGSVIPSVLEQ